MSDFSFKFRVTMRGEQPVDVTSGPAEMVRLEQKYDVSLGAMADTDSMRFGYLAYMAWSAHQRTLPTEARIDFDAWLDVLEDLEIETGDTEPGVALAITGAPADLTVEQVLVAQDELNQLLQTVSAARAADPTQVAAPMVPAPSGV